MELLNHFKSMLLILPRLLYFLGGHHLNALSFFPFIILKSKDQKDNKKLIRHEKIHWRQQIELFFIGFYVLYPIFYLLKRISKMPHHEAYLNIPFEKEAYAYQDNLKTSWYGWIQFI